MMVEDRESAVLSLILNQLPARDWDNKFVQSKVKFGLTFIAVLTFGGLYRTVGETLFMTALR